MTTPRATLSRGPWRCSSDLSHKRVEAEGIEPSSRNNSNGGLYMLSRFFDLGPGGGKRHSPPAPSRLYLVR